MTMPSERTRALIWAGEFLCEIQRSDTAPAALKEQAQHIMRHFPEAGEIMLAAQRSIAIDAPAVWLAPVEHVGDWR